MLDTIVIVILILSALVYGFWQYFARPAAKARDKKSKQRLTIFGNHAGFHAVISDVFSAQRDSYEKIVLSSLHRRNFAHSSGTKNGLKETAKKANRDFLQSFANRDSSRLFYNFR